MKYKMMTICFLIGLMANPLFASDLTISNVRAVNRTDILETPVSVIFDISWKNSWHNQKNHDAVWVFMKFGTQWDNHVKLVPNGHKILKNRSGETVNPEINISPDSLGFFIYPSKNFRGDINLKLQIVIDTSLQEISYRNLEGLSVHGIEMVYIPEGPFTLGSPDEAATKRAAFYKSDNDGNRDGLISIDSEESIEVGPQKGALYYWSETSLYNGDQMGPIPDEFPKGYDDFYIMKYELTQGQYASFLNTLPANWTYLRSPMGGIDYYKKRGCIRLENGKYVADNPNRPMNYISFTDGLAYSDWAAIRPITELEYEKAARGPSTPIEGEFVWGTNTYNDLERYVNTNFDVAFTNGVEEKNLNDQNRSVFGASYYWVMDLSGSLWEKVITVGNPLGRAFIGSHGDGKLDFGEATNDDWPKSNNEKGGFGYRGGGYYNIGGQYGDFNPHSPIGYRYYGSWSGGPRYLAYGYRGGRSI